ncbi:MAG: winged helix-turn-helix transcriptional regulator [Alphaproteobacteria bacterium]|nr:winged helix-turn-helix transcriptional regulator [Alphaproteobacteria bacterium]
MSETAPTLSLILALLKGFYWYEDSIRSYVRSHGWTEFTHSQAILMTLVLLGYRHPSDIARQLGISRQAVHITIGQMVKMGFVLLENDPKNRHIKQVVFTKIGEKMRQVGLDGLERVNAELGRRVGKKELAHAAKVLSADWGEPLDFGPENTAPRKQVHYRK